MQKELTKQQITFLISKFRVHKNKLQRANRKTGKFQDANLRTDQSGYLSVVIQNADSDLSKRMIKAHRLIWILSYGAEPIGDLDHIDRNKKNNHISNLRLATKSQNKRNSDTRSKTSGYKGVSWDNKSNLWMAQVALETPANTKAESKKQMRMKRTTIGRYATAEEAARAFDNGCRRLLSAEALEFQTFNFPKDK